MNCIKEHRVTRNLAALVNIVILLLIIPVAAFTEITDQTVLIHVNNLNHTKGFTLQSIVSTSLGALKQGRKVIIYFDAGAVKAIKIGRWYGGDTTVLDKVNLNEEQRKKLSENLKLSFASTPSNYGDLFRLLRGKGIELYANRAIIKGLDLDEEQYDTAFDLINYDQIMEILSGADVYLSY